MPSFQPNRVLPWLPFLAIAAVLALYLSQPLPLLAVRNAVFDQYQRWQPRVYRDAPVRIVDLDEQSLARIGQWPWPRTRVAELVERLQQAGAAAIVFDVLFAERDRTSPSALLRDTPLPPAVSAELARLPDNDEVLAGALRNGGVVLGFAAERGESSGELPASRFGSVLQGASPLPWLPVFRGTVAALPALQRAAAGNGSMTFLPDADGVVRRVPLFLRVGDTLLPSLVAEALRVGQGARSYRLRVDEDSGIEQVGVGAARIPTTASGEMWVHFTEHRSSRSLPAWQVLAGEAPASALAGAIVLIGTSAQGLQDLRFSPLGGIIPGVEVHAQALEQVLGGDYLTRPGWAMAVETVLVLLGGILLSLLALRSRALVSTLVGGAILLALSAAGWLAFARYQLLLDLFVPSLGLGVVFIVASIVRHMAAEREQRWVREAFSRYVSPNLVAHLMKNPGQLQLGGQRQQCSFVFTDLTGYTRLMESQPAEEAVGLLNDYLEGIIRIAFAHDGTLDRIVGDAVAIMFSAPVPQADHPARALACGQAIQRFTEDYAATLQARGTPFGLTRIGVHSGEVVVGNFGGSAIFDYRALGDPVNTASRLESLNQHIGTTLCVSAAIREHCPWAPMRAVGRVVLKGKSEPVAVFEPLRGEAADEPYDAAFALLEQDPAGALEAFEALHAARPDDGLVAFHVHRLRAGERGAQWAMTRK
ncbi:CHASE2 domain-containing protein [Pseudomonas kuykendallii]|uniref:CHASE2 domain-containing protein n=1 Tax=Pseudomonas kuykendallii TaxID=1007099 RepID=UPI0023522461|nr:adenylate/guanylate cyclase domain-containing protein [Pseudomonas kuykendallii]